MYKITLYDYCCSPICDGTHWFLTENLEEFEKNWLPLQAKHSIDCINRYYKSKFGEIVTDYYSDNPELNIVQNVDFEIIDSKEYEYIDIDIELENTYSYETIVNFDRIIFKIIKAQVIFGSGFSLICNRIIHWTSYFFCYNRECKVVL